MFIEYIRLYDAGMYLRIMCSKGNHKYAFLCSMSKHSGLKLNYYII